MSIKILDKQAIEPYTCDILNSSFLRTGSMSQHSLLYSICLAFKYYRNKMESEPEMCQSLLDQMMAKIQMDDWFEKEHIHRLLLNYWTQFMDAFEMDTRFSKEEKESIEFLAFFWKKENQSVSSHFELKFPLSYVECLSMWEEQMYSFLHQCIEHLELEIQEKGDEFSKMSKSHKKKVIFHFIRISKLLLDTILEDHFRTFLQSDQKGLSILLPYLFESFQINILILNADTGKPSVDCMKYLDLPYCFDNPNPFIVLLHFPSVDHFECLGKQMKRSPQSPLVLSRFFTKKDPFIITYLAYLESQFPDAFRKD